MAALRPALAAALFVVGMGVAVTAAAAPAAHAESVPGHVIVRFEPGVGAPGRQAALGQVRGRVLRALPVARAAVVSVPGADPGDLAHTLEADPRVSWAEPDYIYHRLLLPTDTGFPQQWGLVNTGQSVNGNPAGVAGADIDASSAWDTTIGSPAVKLAIIDGGVDATHPDLAPNFATPANPGETGAGRETNRVDDDGNGLIDDFRGWDFVGADNDPDDDSVGHGTLVAGVAAARGNEGAGAAGVSWQARLIAIRALDASGRGTAESIAAALAYAGERGARIVNASFGGPVISQAISDVIADYPNMLFVTAAGNGGDDGVADNVDGLGEVDFPCELTLPNVICVAATNQADALTSFSNFGATSVDLAAPGQDIFGPKPGPTFQFLDGTSFASPFVAGAASLVLAAHPTASTAQLRGALLAGVDPLPGLTDRNRIVTGGRLNVRGALASVPAAGPGPRIETGPAAPDAAGTTARLTGTVTPRGQRTSTYFEYGTATTYGSETPTRRVGAGTTPVTLAEGIGDLVPGTHYEFRAVAADATGISFGPNQSFVAPAPGSRSGSPIGSRDLSIVRRGLDWFARLRLTSVTVVTGSLERRVAGGRRSRVRFRSVHGIRRRGLQPGTRLLALGRLRPGTYRLTLKVNSAAGPQQLRRGFGVPASPILGVRITTRAGLTVATVRLAARARLRGGLERRSGSRFAFLRPFVTRALAPGTREVRLGRHLAPGLYRVRLEALGSAGGPTTVTFSLP